MSYRRSLLFRWSRRDVLAIAALAAVVAFLTGSALFYSAAADRPAALANDFDSIGGVSDYPSVDDARQAAENRDILLPYSVVQERETLVVGLSRTNENRLERAGFQIPSVPSNGIGHTDATAGQRTFTTAQSGEVTLNTTGDVGTGFVPDRWYVARPAVVERLGSDGAIVVRPSENETAVSSSQVKGNTDSVIRGSLLFFERGTDQLLRGFVLLVVAAGVLGAVTVTSVVRMTVRDREQTIRVIRASGGPPQTVLGLFALRGLLLTATAITLGYALGVVASSVVVQGAVFVGLPTSLSARVTPGVVGLLFGIYVPVLLVGAASGAVAALPAVRRPPVVNRPRVRSHRTQVLSLPRELLPDPVVRRVASALRPSMLDWRAVVPTAATVAVFTVLVLLIIAGGVIATPLTTSSATVLEPNAKHPFASSVPESYGSAFESRGVTASPEILVFGIVNDSPALIRGAQYDKFAAVSNATLLVGSEPNGTGEALVGRDFADTHDIAVGDSVVLGGGVAETVDRVHVVGTYRAPGVFDDQLLVSLETARHLSLKGGSNVNFIRLSRPVDRTPTSGVQVTGVGVTGQATTENVTVDVTLRNFADSTKSRDVFVSLGEERVRRTVTVGPNNRTVESFTFVPPQSGRYTLSAGNQSRNVSVVDANDLSLRGLPRVVPVDSSPRVTIRTVTGRPVANATVMVGNRTVRTSGDGSVRLPFDRSGSTIVRVRAGDSRLNRTVTVSANASRRLGVTVRVVPDRIAAFVRPTVEVRLSNPWERTITRPFEVRTARTEYRRQVSVEGGGVVTRSVRLARQPRGDYRVSVAVAGEHRTETTYRVVDGDRLSTVVARNTDTEAGASLGVAISTVFGNLQVVVVGLVTLAGLMVAGTLVASFSRTIHARRRTLGVYRATGATPRQVATMLLRDGVVIGSVSVGIGLLLGVALLWMLDAQNALVFFGIAVTPTYSLPVLLFVGGVAFALVLVGLLVSAAAVLARPPASLFETGPRPPEEDSR